MWLVSKAQSQRFKKRRFARVVGANYQIEPGLEVQRL